MSTLELKELSHPAGEVIKIAAGKTLDLKSQGSVTMPTGSVLQVVSTHSNVSTSLATSALTNIGGGSVTITPKSTSSTILVSLSAGGLAMGAGSGHNIGLALYRDSTQVLYRDRHAYHDTSDWTTLSWDCQFMDSPNTTSAVTYTWAANSNGLSGYMVRVNDWNSSASNTSMTVTAMEIQG
mgnify:CR=1 FL=1